MGNHENLWATYGQPMGNLWATMEISGQSMGKTVKVEEELNLSLKN